MRVIIVWLSGGSKVSKVIRLWAGQSGFIILAGARDFFPTLTQEPNF